MGFFFHAGGKKNKNKFSWPAVVGRKKNKKGKFDRFSVQMAIFRGKKVMSSEVNPACRRKKLKKAEMAPFFFSSDIIPSHRRARHP